MSCPPGELAAAHIRLNRNARRTTGMVCAGAAAGVVGAAASGAMTCVGAAASGAAAAGGAITCAGVAAGAGAMT